MDRANRTCNIVFHKVLSFRLDGIQDRHIIYFLTKFLYFSKSFFLKTISDQKVSFKKTIFTFKSIFYDFEWVHISNKQHKSHVWPKKKKKKYFFSKFSSKVKPFCKVYFDVNKKNHGMCGCLVPHWVECVYACVCLSIQSIFPKVMFFCKVYFGVNKKKK